MKEVNFAKNQQERDGPNPRLIMCYRIGRSHKSMGWSRTPDGHWDAARRQAYFDGYDGTGTEPVWEERVDD